MDLRKLMKDFHQLKLGANVLNCALDRTQKDETLERIYSLSQCLENTADHIFWLLMKEVYKNEH